MIVIVEGMDRCGKDTLIKHLRSKVLKRPKTTMMHCVSPPKPVGYNWALTHYTELLSQVRKMSDDGWDIILNRSHLGEDVYGPLFRKKKAEWVYTLDLQFLQGNDVMLVTLVDDPEKVLEREDGESLSDNIDKIKAVRESFIRVHDKSYIPHKILYDYSIEGGELEDMLYNMETLIIPHREDD